MVWRKFMVGVLEASGHYGADTDVPLRMGVAMKFLLMLLACGAALVSGRASSADATSPGPAVLEDYEENGKQAQALAEKLDARGDGR
jgi:hypothetical protein